ncbi:hypothetical protein HZA98_05300 [Candidatus Woesearchaeota archaeon]|nr:hypothetical protein [Candidatus Woesearchaeota archaeon]
MEEEMFETIVTKRPNTIAFYFGKVKELELSEVYLNFFSDEARNVYRTALHEVYDILFDRIVTSDVSVFLKQEAEQWYSFNRDFLGFTEVGEVNRDLEGMLRRFNLI